MVKGILILMASKRAQRRKACDGKQRFESSQQAMGALMRLKRGKPDAGFMNAYRCKFCGGFHFGHPPKR